MKGQVKRLDLFYFMCYNFYMPRKKIVEEKKEEIEEEISENPNQNKKLSEITEWETPEWVIEMEENFKYLEEQ